MVLDQAQQNFVVSAGDGFAKQLQLYLADTSAWRRANASRAVADRWERLLEDDALAICAPIELELLYSARSPSDYEDLREELAGVVHLPLTEAAAGHARRAQAALAAKSQHRGPAAVDLLIAGVAEAAGTTLLHYDRHFEAISSVTGQDAEWLAPRGTLR
jgi:predicted nucleic acid-binding protein